MAQNYSYYTQSDNQRDADDDFNGIKSNTYFSETPFIVKFYEYLPKDFFRIQVRASRFPLSSYEYSKLFKKMEDNGIQYYASN